jgi:hypothetical protein
MRFATVMSKDGSPEMVQAGYRETGKVWVSVSSSCQDRTREILRFHRMSSNGYASAGLGGYSFWKPDVEPRCFVLLFAPQHVSLWDCFALHESSFAQSESFLIFVVSLAVCFRHSQSCAGFLLRHKPRPERIRKSVVFCGLSMLYFSLLTSSCTESSHTSRL